MTTRAALASGLLGTPPICHTYGGCAVRAALDLQGAKKTSAVPLEKPPQTLPGIANLT
jgi:hypothetical protein